MPHEFKPLHIHDLLYEAYHAPRYDCLGRDKEFNHIARIVRRSEHNNVVVVGKRGGGKTSLVHGLATRLAARQYARLRPLPYLQIDSEQLGRQLRTTNNQSAYLAHLERALASLPPSIVVVDEAPRLLDELPTPQHCEWLVRPFAQSPDRHLILTFEAERWETLQDELGHWLTSFDVLRLTELDREACISILTDRARFIAGRHRVKLTAEVPVAVYEYTQQLSEERAQPDRALRFLDEVCAAAVLRDRVTIQREDVQHLFAERTGLPTPQLDRAGQARLRSLRGTLQRKVLGQEHVIKMVADVIQRGWLGLKNPQRPLGSFLFLGPSGVGKTELAKVVAQEVYGSDKALVRIDMSEYAESHNVQRLLGAPPGYVGYEAGGQLTNPIRERPFSLILLDEIEKADPRIFDIFLQVLDDGRLTDGQGATVDFSKTIIMATSNIGIEDIVNGWLRDEEVTASAWLKRRLLPHLTQHFRLEFLNRFEGMSVFSPLSEADLLAVAQLELQKMEKRFAHKHVRFQMSPAVLQRKVQELSDPRFGARPLKRWLEAAAESSLAEQLLSTP